MEIPEVLTHWIPVPVLAFGCWFFLKKFFSDLELKLGGLVTELKSALKQQNEHNTRLGIIEERLKNLEYHPPRRRR